MFVFTSTLAHNMCRDFHTKNTAATNSVLRDKVRIIRNNKTEEEQSRKKARKPAIKLESLDDIIDCDETDDDADDEDEEDEEGEEEGIAGLVAESDSDSSSSDSSDDEEEFVVIDRTHYDAFDNDDFTNINTGIFTLLPEQRTWKDALLGAVHHDEHPHENQHIRPSLFRPAFPNKVAGGRRKIVVEGLTPDVDENYHWTKSLKGGKDELKYVQEGRTLKREKKVRLKRKRKTVHLY